MGEEIIAWLRGHRIGIQDQPDDPRMTFGFTAVLQDGIPVSIFRMKDERSLQLQTMIVLMEPHRSAIMEKMTPYQKRALINDIAIELTRADLGWDMTEFQGEGKIGIFSQMIFDETLAEGDLLRRVGVIWKGATLTRRLIDRHAEIADPSIVPSTFQGPQSTPDTVGSQP